MDFIVNLLRTQNNHDTIWVIIDRLTKMPIFIPIKTMVATQDVVYQFINELFRFYRLPLMRLLVISRHKSLRN